MLNVSQLRRCYQDFVAVNQVSFSILTGDIVGLLGHNGAGKTTIMKMLSGYLEPDEGEIYVDNINLCSHPKQVQQHLGYLPENLPLYPEMTVIDYLDYAANLKGLFGNKTTEIKRVIEATHIETKLLAPITTLSRGFKQRVGVAQAILGKPKLLILDEPTNGLDPEQTQLMRELIRDIAQEATVIISTHIMQEVEVLCNRVLILNAGHLLVDAPLSELRQSNAIRISTSLHLAEMKTSLSSLSGIGNIQTQTAASSQNPPIHHYRIQLIPTAASAGIEALCAQIAQCLIENNAALYQLYVEKRDLETLFTEVNQPQTHPKKPRMSKPN